MKILRRNLSLMLALRYLNPLRTMFSIITLICLAGVALGVTVLIVVMSVMQGLQSEIESRVLAFEPHYRIQSVYVAPDGSMSADYITRIPLTEQAEEDESSEAPPVQEVQITEESEAGTDSEEPLATEASDEDQWLNPDEVMAALRKVEGVTAVYPDLSGDAFAQFGGRNAPVQFIAVQPHNNAQFSCLYPMVRASILDADPKLKQQVEDGKVSAVDAFFGDGANAECVVSTNVARQLGLRVGDDLTITPLGNVRQIADIYAKTQKPLQTHENKEFTEAVAHLRDGLQEDEEGCTAPAAEKLTRLAELLDTFMTPEASKNLRQSEEEIIDNLETVVSTALHARPLTPKSQAQWKELAPRLADVFAKLPLPRQTPQTRALAAELPHLTDGAEPSAEGCLFLPTGALRVLQQELTALSSTTDPADQSTVQEGLAFADRLLQRPLLTREQNTLWEQTAKELAALDREREDGKALRGINEMVMPTDLRVVAVYQPPENMPGPGVYLPMEIAQQAMGLTNGEIQQLCVRVQDANNPGDIEQRMAAALPKLHSSPTGPMCDWLVTPWTKSFESWYKLIANERIMMNFVLSIISLIASFCIMAVMFAVSVQRRREIAVLQALGATPRKIMGIFAWQGVIIGVLGAVLGVLLALLVLHYRLEIQSALAGIGMDPFPIEAHGTKLPAVYDPVVFANQALRAFIMVTVAAIIPAFIISRRDPAKALRS